MLSLMQSMVFHDKLFLDVSWIYSKLLPLLISMGSSFEQIDIHETWKRKL